MMNFYISDTFTNGSGQEFNNKKDFLKELSLMIDDCVANGGKQFDITVDTDASCFATQDQANTKKFGSYSEFCLWITEHDDEVDYILEYDDWSVVLIDGQYWYYEHEFEGASDKYYQVEPIATLHYSIVNDIKSDKHLDELFDCDMCGEQVTDDEIIYWWFKELE